MNYPMIGRTLGYVLLIAGALLLLPPVVALIYGETSVALCFALTAAFTALLGFGLTRLKPQRTELFAREGFVIVTFGWMLLSALGAVPYVLTGDIPSYVDALFETVSGLTTTGSTIVTDVTAMSRGCMFWRCFTHWLGGMGILVFVMAVLPMNGQYSMHIMRAEVPGPTVGKLVPRARKTAMILYLIYAGMTVILVILLLAGGMDLYDAVIHSFSTAGTGGFSNQAQSIGTYNSPYFEWVIGIFMILFGINFNLYYFILIRRWREAVKSEELHWFLVIVTGSTLAIAVGITNFYGSFGTALRQAFFQVSTLVSTTGYCSTNYELWPEYTKWILLMLTAMGACAGSTGGGIKVSRVMLLVRSARAELHRLARPRELAKVRLEGSIVDQNTVHSTLVYFGVYSLLLFGGAFVISFDGFDAATNFTALIACLSNVGPGLNVVGPTGSFAGFSDFSKLFLSWCMLVGRLEIYPMLLLLVPSMWKRG